MNYTTLLYSEDLKKAETLSNGLKVFKAVSSVGSATLKMWRPKASKPYVNYYFKTEESRDAYLAQKIKEFDDSKAAKKKWHDDRKAQKDAVASDAKVGDIFVKSWGYSMIIVDFYQLISRTAKQGTFRQLKTMITSGDGMQGRCIPLKWQFDDLYTKEFKAELGKFRKWDGVPQHFDHLD